MTVVTFAVPQESSSFRRALRAAGGRFGGEEVRVAHLGIGPAAAATSMRQLLVTLQPRTLICAGFAGGLDPRVRSGDLVIADNFTTPELRSRALAVTGERPHRFFGVMVSRMAPVETVAAKAELAKGTGALAVDMETETVAECCRRARVTILAVRAISDSVTTALPVPFAEWFDLRRQRPRPLALMGYLAAHPASVAPFAQFVRDLAPARRALGSFIARFLGQPPGD